MKEKEESFIEEKMMTMVLIGFVINVIEDTWSLVVGAARLILIILLVAFFILRFRIDKKYKQLHEPKRKTADESNKEALHYKITELDNKIRNAQEQLANCTDMEQRNSIQENINILELLKDDLIRLRK
jgi:hypothetical protein